MNHKNYISESVRGIKGTFLIKDGCVIESDLTLNADAESLFEKIASLVLSCSNKGDIKRISIRGKDQLQIYIDDPFILGVLTPLDANFPVVNVVAKRVLNVEEFVELTLARLKEIREGIKP